MIAGRQHMLTLDLPAKPVYVRGDRVRLEQIFTNLLTNAAKYTDPGGKISLSVAVVDDQAVIKVADNGLGLDPEVLPTLFDLFAQVNPQLDRSEAGLGIGLTVVRSLVELHGGQILRTARGWARGANSNFGCR